ncbi:SpoIIE family protein phosphatase [Streptomyces sp. NPDC057424]|uniref:SpoIIE family protein phosphatase n=1 Tax=Streptomyces sp. NPDC057424 TaxID=3346127 RepID=UPI003681545F
MEGRVPEDLAVVVDTDGAIMAWSDGARRLLGYEPAELLGMPVTGLLAADLPESTRRHVADGRRWAGEVALRHREGNRVVVRLQGTPLADAAGGRRWLVTGTVPAYPAARTGRGALPLWDLTLAQLPVPVAVYDRDARLVAANEIMAEVMGRPEEEMKGLTLWEIEPNPPFDTYDRLQREVLRTGEMIFHEEHSKAPGHTGPHAWSMFLSPLKDEAGAVQGMSATVFDTTEQYWARRRLAVLNEASLRIGSTLDVTRTAEEMAEVAVTGGFADFVTVDLLESVALGHEPGPLPPDTPVTVRRTAQRSVLEGCPESVVATGETTRYPVGTLPLRTLGSGRGARHRPGDPELREWLNASPGRAESMSTYMIHSVMMVPLRARGVTLGLVHFLRHRTAEWFSEDDLLLAEEIVGRAAVSVDNARRFTRERRTALALQRSLLPERPPEMAAMDVAYRYLPTGAGADIGGDWFDVIPLSGARVALVVGDVVGHGIQASATMGRLRTAVRTLADVDLAPDELLTQLDDLVIRLDREEGPEVRGAQEASGQVGATCLYAVYDPVSRRCTMARAGHPAPALVTPEGGVRFLDLPAGPPLGLGGLPFEAAEVQLEENSLLALYTDGLIEAPGHDVEAGLGLLHRALSSPAGTLDETCDRVLRTVLSGRPEDDIVLMLARTAVLDAGKVRTWQLPPEAAAVARARKMAGEQLAEWGLTEAEFATELIVSELVTNALRYGGAPIELRLIRDSTLICEVSDGSNTAPHLRRARVFDEGGRGLLLVAQLAERWGSRQTATGKTIWAEQPLPAAL